MRDRSFGSLDELRAVVRAWLDEYNSRPFQKRDGSRRSVFESEGEAVADATAGNGVRGGGLVYFVKLRWTLSALNLNTFGVQLEHRRRLVPCFLLFVWLAYFMRECLFR